MYTKEVKLCEGLKAGYLVFYDREHPLAHADGSVYYHRHIASLAKGRWISSMEHVHHIDGNKLNNSSLNLEVLSASEHGKLHNANKEPDSTCTHCRKLFKPIPQSKVKAFCSQECYKQYTVKRKDITKELLDSLIPVYTWIELGRLFGYSDVGIRKRAKALGCNIPIRRTTKK